MRRFVIGVVVVGLGVGLTAPAFATGRQIICWTSVSGNAIPFWGANYNGMRFQTLIDQNQIGYAGKINQVEFNNSAARGARFNAYKLILCHCGTTNLSNRFQDNYKGVAVLAANLSSFTVPAYPGWFGLGMTTATFNYNNTDHLLIEIQWLGDNGATISTRTGAVQTGRHRIWQYNNPQAPVGMGDGRTYYTRLSFNSYSGAKPTSLGRVKAIFE
jgi:hypothetical protein